MSKSIIIVGGGISGLTSLHYIKSKFANSSNVHVRLFEKNNHLGGTIRSIQEDGFIFETGPNGFLDSKPQTLNLVRELNLDSELTKAHERSKARFIAYNNKLHKVPQDPGAFLATELLSLNQKLRAIKEIFVPKGQNENESVFDFGKRRIGERFSEIFLDAMVGGIYAGDPKKLNLKESFSRIYELEQTYGSLFKAMIELQKNKKTTSSFGAPKGVLHSFKNGMEALISTLGEKYKDFIELNAEVIKIEYDGTQYCVYLDKIKYRADILVLSLPAYQAAKLIEPLSHDLSDILAKIFYAPVAVVGVVLEKKGLKPPPEGFGYLVPQLEDDNVLGVLFENNIFPERDHPEHFLFRVMLGGARSPDIGHLSSEDHINLATNELSLRFGVQKDPVKTFYTFWPKGIPQYDERYLLLKRNIRQHLLTHPNLHLNANYWRGISLNDCIDNAYRLAQKIPLC